MAILKQTVKLPGAYDLEPGGLRATWDKIYLGLVRDVNDARNMGRIRVWIPELGGAINNEATWIICDYASPFAGASNVADVNLNPTSSQTDYGMTFIPPDLNNQVLVCFINGDPSRGVWFGCLFQVDRNHMTPSTPASSPQEQNPNIFTGESPTFLSGYDAARESGGVNLPIEQGGPAPRGMQQGIRTMGIRTPYGHTFVMDDTPEDAFIRLQTRGLAQIVIHDTKDRIIINTGPNRARIEMDKEGNIDIFGQKSVSVSAGQDINLHADRDVNIEAGGSIKMRSLDETRMFSKKPFNISSGGDVLLFSQGNMHLVSNSNIYNTAVGSLQYRSNYGIFLTTQESNIDIKNLTGNIRLFAGGNVDASSTGDVRLRSTNGNLNLVASADVKVQSTGTLNLIGGADVKVQGNGSVNLRSGAGSVNTGPKTVLNVANLPDAAKPTNPDNPITAVPGVVALSPDIRTEERVQLQNVVSPARSIQIVQTIVSRLPGADPWRQRSVAGPGYSNTGLVQRKTTPPESTYKVGQVSPAQDKPLQVYGIVNGQTGLHIGESWDESGTPQYTFKQLGPRVLLPSTEWTVNNRGIQTIIDHEGLGGNLIGKPFDDACKSGQKLLGYGHLLTSEELQNNTVTLNATDDSGTQISTQLNVGEGISETNMKVLLKTDIKKIEGKIHSSIGSNLLTQDQFNSLADFIYNIGSDNFDKSGITGMISSGDYNKVPNEMIRWILACNNQEKFELKTRRLNNAFLFSGQARPDADFSATASGAGKGFDSNQAKKAWCYLKGKGYQPEHIAGLLGNFAIEAPPLNPREDRNPTFKGLAQWNSDRFKNMPRAIGVSWPQLSQLSNDTALYKSLDFVDWEFKNTHRNAYSKMLATNSPESAARAVNEYYEISASGLEGQKGTITPEAQSRFNTAKTIFDQLNGTQCG